VRTAFLLLGLTPILAACPGGESSARDAATPDAPIGTVDAAPPIDDAAEPAIDAGPTVRAWGTATRLQPGELDIAQVPSVGIDDAGRATALWPSDGIATTRHEPGAGWAAATVLDATHGEYPEIAVAPAGDAVAVWRQFADPVNLATSRYVVGSGWEANTLLETDDAYGHHVGYLPEVAIDAGGNAIAVWDQVDVIWARRFVPGTGWGTAVPLGDGVNPWIAVDPSGNGLAIWMRPDDGEPFRFSLWSSHYVAGGSWSAAVAIETDDAGPATRVRAAMDDAGNAIAVWHEYDGTRSSVWANRYVAGTGWGTAEKLETVDGHAGDPEVDVDPAGNAIAVWEQSDGTRLNVVARRFEPATGWGAATVLNGGDVGGFSPVVAMDAAGEAIAVWPQFDATRNLWASRFVPGSGWDTPVRIDAASSGDSLFTQIAMNADGDAVVVWERSVGPSHSGVPFQIWGNTFD
jgi:hypothetical protein